MMTESCTSDVSGRRALVGELRLPKRATRSFPAGRVAIECLQGEFWVTVEGDRVDYYLRPGDWLAVNRRARVVLQALSDASMRVERHQ